MGKKLRWNAVKVSYSWRCASAAMVSKTNEDLPDPETPVKTVILRLGICSEMSLQVVLMRAGNGDVIGHLFRPGRL